MKSFFSSKKAPIAKEVEKATDSEMLLNADIGINLAICDSVNQSPPQIAALAIKELRGRLQSKNPKQTLLALSLLEMLMKNGYEPLHQLVAHKDTLDVLRKIVNNKKTDFVVFEKTLELVQAWGESFDPEGPFPEFREFFEELQKDHRFPPLSTDNLFAPQSTPGYAMDEATAMAIAAALAEDDEGAYAQRPASFAVPAHTSSLPPSYEPTPLPRGWEQCTTADGVVYFKDHNTKTTHWHPPDTSAPARRPPVREIPASALRAVEESLAHSAPQPAPSAESKLLAPTHTVEQYLRDLDAIKANADLLSEMVGFAPPEQDVSKDEVVIGLNQTLKELVPRLSGLAGDATDETLLMRVIAVTEEVNAALIAYKQRTETDGAKPIAVQPEPRALPVQRVEPIAAAPVQRTQPVAAAPEFDLLSSVMTVQPIPAVQENPRQSPMSPIDDEFAALDLETPTSATGQWIAFGESPPPDMPQGAPPDFDSLWGTQPSAPMQPAQQPATGKKASYASEFDPLL